MEKKVLEKIPGLEVADKITIWKMNYGFKSDLQGEVSKMVVSSNSKGNSGEASMDIAKFRTYTLVFGIFEAPVIGITQPRDLGLGFSQEEINTRIRAIRALDQSTGDYLFKEINDLNKDPSEELKKKLNI